MKLDPCTREVEGGQKDTEGDKERQTPKSLELDPCTTKLVTKGETNGDKAPVPGKKKGDKERRSETSGDKPPNHDGTGFVYQESRR